MLFTPSEHTPEEIMADIMVHTTPEERARAHPIVVLELSATGWAAYEESSIGTHIEEGYSTAKEAASALWQWYWDNLWSKRDTR